MQSSGRVPRLYNTLSTLSQEFLTRRSGMLASPDMATLCVSLR